jgi:hypothetical protein
MPVDDSLVAAHLAAAIIQAHGQQGVNVADTRHLPLANFAATMYFDCLMALEEERAKRQKSQVQS